MYSFLEEYADELDCTPRVSYLKSIDHLGNLHLQTWCHQSIFFIVRRDSRYSALLARQPWEDNMKSGSTNALRAGMSHTLSWAGIMGMSPCTMQDPLRAWRKSGSNYWSSKVMLSFAVCSILMEGTANHQQICSPCSPCILVAALKKDRIIRKHEKHEVTKDCISRSIYMTSTFLNHYPWSNTVTSRWPPKSAIFPTCRNGRGCQFDIKAK